MTSFLEVWLFWCFRRCRSGGKSRGRGRGGWMSMKPLKSLEKTSDLQV